MTDPTLAGLVQAIRDGDPSAKPALVDYLLEQADPRAEAVRKADSLDEVLACFPPYPYLHWLDQHLRWHQFAPHPLPGGENCYVGAPMAASSEPRSVEFLTLETITVVERPELDVRGLADLCREYHEPARALLPDQGILHRLSTLYAEYILAVVPCADPTLTAAVEKRRPRRVWHWLGNGAVTVVLYDPIARKLHHFSPTVNFLQWLWPPNAADIQLYGHCSHRIDTLMRPRTPAPFLASS